MENKLISAMQHDMKITRYEGECKEYYVGRLVYSALSHWLRYIILDEVSQHPRYKSKAYVLKRGQVILENLVECLPICKKWVYKYNGNNQEDPVKNIRQKMIFAGELLEVDVNGNISLPLYQKEYENRYIRIKGLREPEETTEFVGITRIQQSDSNINKESLIKSIEPEQYIEWLFENGLWSKCLRTENYEFFNPYSTKPPYQSWTDRIVKSIDYYLGRLTLYNGMHEYYLLKNKMGIWYNCKLSTVLAEYKEERRIILGLRKKYGNHMAATYSMMNSVVILNLYCRLPLREQGIIETFCWPLNGWNDRLNYVTSIKLWPYVESLLVNDLGIKLKGES